jgi:hypothetical protein
MKDKGQELKGKGWVQEHTKNGSRRAHFVHSLAPSPQPLVPSPQPLAPSRRRCED